MKTISKIILAISVVFAAFSCGDPQSDGPVVSEMIVAEWHLVSVSGLSSTPHVYVDFRQDLSFELYQKVGEGRYRKFDGTYAVSGTILSGKYSDGEKWGSDYAVSFDGEKMLLTAQNGSEEVCTYEKKALSETDKAEAILVTKSAQDGPRFL
jgi:hypothetical protein